MCSWPATAHQKVSLTSACISSFSVLPIFSFAVTVPLEVHTFALAECFKVSLCISCRSLGSYLNQQRLFLSVCDGCWGSHLASRCWRTAPESATAWIWSVDHFDVWLVSIYSHSYFLTKNLTELLDAVITRLALSLRNFVNMQVLIQIVLFLFCVL